MDEEAFDQHISVILSSRRIRDRIVVLCEGDSVGWSDRQRARSPQTYRRHKEPPDSSFYLSCIPSGWQNHKLPCFFNCGDRYSVLKTYRRLRTAHEGNPNDTYLNPSKLFALVDLDLQPQPIDDYFLPDI